jgi:hypothetical protein
MINLIYGKTKLRIPNRLVELPLYKGVEIFDHLQKIEEPKLVDKISIIGLISGLDVDILMAFTEETIDDIWNKMEISKDHYVCNYFSLFSLDGQLYGLKDFKELTVKEYADIEFAMSEGDTPFSNIHKIMGILFRPVVYKKRTLKNVLKNIIVGFFYRNVKPIDLKTYRIEEYDETKTAEEVFLKRLDFSFGYGVLLAVTKYIESIKESYPILFHEKTEETEDADNRFLEFDEIWGFYGLLMKITNKDIIQRDVWLSKPIKELLTYLSYLKQLSIYEARTHR